MKISRLLSLTGAALLLIALSLMVWKAGPIVSSRLYTRSISTAPPLEGAIQSPVPEEGELMLLPFESTGTVPEKTSDPVLSPTPAVKPPTPTLIPTPTLANPGTPTPAPPTGVVPASLEIPILDLEAQVVPIGMKTVTVNGTAALMWDVPDYRAVGWHDTSALLGLAGNTVFNGHNTSSGEVFRDLYRVPVGALVTVMSQEGAEFAYRVKEKYILSEAGQPLEVRLQNAMYVQKTVDERLTLVTCHPYGSLANRLIVIAVPAPPASQRGE